MRQFLLAADASERERIVIRINDEATDWYTAKLCIHPRQVATIHSALAPNGEELAWAQRVMGVMEAARQGAGALQPDGRMIDKPVIERARRVIECAIR